MSMKVTKEEFLGTNKANNINLSILISKTVLNLQVTIFKAKKKMRSLWKG